MLSQYLPDPLKHQLKYFLRPDYREKIKEKQTIRSISRFSETIIPFRGRELKIIDSGTLPFLVEEILEKEVYKFSCGTEAPRILDCGANIGLSVIYFKQLFPKSSILAFEPDSRVFSALKHNIQSFGLEQVELVQKGLWREEGELSFAPDKGSTAGRISEVETISAVENGKASITDSDEETVSIQVDRLKKHLSQKVHFLKMDIEGAETEVIKDCQGSLENVEKIFIEYHSYVDQKQDLSELVECLVDSGFRIFVESPAIINKQPFLETTSYKSMDMMLNISGVRI